MSMRCLELFAGAGGLAKGFDLAGFSHTALLEWNADACRTLRQNFTADSIHQVDIKQVDFTTFADVDFVVGGPPCQPFSLGGKAKGNLDERDMFPFAIKSIRDIRPKAFLFENVKGLLRDSFKEYFEFIILGLTYPDEVNNEAPIDVQLLKLRSINFKTYSGVKYQVKYKLVNAADYGIPQKRERVIIVGIRSDVEVDWSFPEPTHSEDALMWSKFVTNDYWRRHNKDNPYSEDVVQEQMTRLLLKFGMFPPEELPWCTIRDAMKPLNESPFASDTEVRKGAREYPGHTGSLLDEPSKTIKAGAHGVPGGENMIKFEDGSVRYLTIGEAKRIQTFPDEYEITGAWTEAMRQLGNAVPVGLSYVMAKHLYDLFTAS